MSNYGINEQAIQANGNKSNELWLIIYCLPSHSVIFHLNIEHKMCVTWRKNRFVFNPFFVVQFLNCLALISRYFRVLLLAMQATNNRFSPTITQGLPCIFPIKIKSRLNMLCIVHTRYWHWQTFQSQFNMASAFAQRDIKKTSNNTGNEKN